MHATENAKPYVTHRKTQYLDFIKFTIEKVNSHSQMVPNIFEVIAITEPSIILN